MMNTNKKISNQLILVRGLPGSGKSTFANHDKYKKFVHCEADDYFYDVCGVYMYDPRERNTSHAFCQYKAFKAMESGENVIVSNTFTTVSEMLPYIRFAQSKEILWSVIECYGKWESKHKVPAEIMEAMKARWESIDFVFKEEFGYIGISKIHLY